MTAACPNPAPLPETRHGMRSVQGQKRWKPGDRDLTAVVSISLALLVLAVYWQVQGHEFLIWDDDVYVTENPHVRSGFSSENVLWAFTTAHGGGYWHPLTWLSHMLDSELYGLNPQNHHWTNLLLHLISSILLFRVLKEMTGGLWQSAFVAAVFSLHPLRMESVAWVAERKDVLGALFWMTTLWAYSRYVRNPGTIPFLSVLCSLALGLMAKPMLVTLPFVLLLLDYWPIGRIRWGQAVPVRNSFQKADAPSLSSLLLEKMPLFLLAGASSLGTFLAARSTGVFVRPEALPLTLRLENALLSCVKYLGKLFWPGDLAFFYPYPQDAPTLWQAAGSLCLLGCLSLLALRSAKRYPYFLVGWTWFLGTLSPVIGLVQVGSHAMADRFTYVPHVGLCICVAWGASDLLGGFRWSEVLLSVVSGTLILLLSLWTWSELPSWRSSYTLFQRGLQVNPDNYLAHFLLGDLRLRQGDLSGAVVHFSETLRLKPGYLPALVNCGSALRQQGKTQAALRCLQDALRIQPLPEVHHNLGLVLAAENRFQEAIVHYEQALRIRPRDARIHNDLAVALFYLGEYGRAFSHLVEALRLNPADPKVHHNLRFVEEHMGRPPGGVNAGPRAAALYVVEKVLSDGFLEEVAAKGRRLRAGLEHLATKHPVVKEARGMGLMQAVELYTSASECAMFLLEAGFLVNCTANTVLRFLPPLVVTAEQIDRMLEALDAALKKVGEA
jgi:tetratricopeptide (TPR) repeat protein